MLKKALLLFTILLFTGCVERGYDLTVNKTTNTVTAIKSVDIRTKEKADTKKDMATMNTAVKKEQEKQTVSKKKPITKTEKTPVEPQVDTQVKDKAQVQKEKELETKNRIAAEKEKENQAKAERQALENKLAKEKEEKRVASEKERMALEQKAKIAKEKAEKEAQIKKAEALKATNEKKVQEALEKKLAEEKQIREQKAKEEKLALERKIAQEKKLQEQKEKEEKAALERKLAEEKKVQKQKMAAEQARKEKEEAARLAKIKEEKALQARKKAEVKKAEEKKLPKATTEALIFRPSKQTYQKFGTSEIHGHVVYMTPTGQEIALKNTKVYLVPKNTKTDHWYNNYYLKNKEASSLSKTTVNYINATHLNLEKNFAFYGLPTGTYYIIIESLYPAHIAKNKKVYIAKKINVEKYKKIMTVFSKKL